MTQTGSAPATHVTRGDLLYRIGRFSARHPWPMLVVWVFLLLAASAASRALGTTYSDSFTLPGSPSAQGNALLQAHLPRSAGQSGQLVFTIDGGSLSAKSTAIETAVRDVGALPHVQAVSNPLTPATTSSDGATAFATVNFDTSPVTLGSSYVASVDKAVAPVRAAGVNVDYGGALGQAARPKANDRISEIIGIVVAILVLLLGFGSVYGAGLPIVSAVIGVFTGLGVLGIVASATTFASVSPTIGIMMGLGVGIDYALFLITRHRQQVMEGVDPAEAAARTVATSGRAVLIAAVTVVIALLGLYASGISFIGKLGVAGAITVAVAALAAITLVPALLAKAGRDIDRLHIRPPVAESGAAGTTAGNGWHRYAARVGAHPWRYLLSGVGVLAVLAIPMFSMTIGHIDAGANPQSYTDRRAYDAISQAFGAGFNGPFTVVVDTKGVTAATTAQLSNDLTKALRGTTDVASVGPIKASPDGAVLYTTVIPRSGPQDPSTDALLSTLRNQTLPVTLSGTPAQGYVTGSTSFQLDFRDEVTSRLPIIIAVVIVAAILLLLAFFRSPVLALKAAVLNLLSIGAAYGVIVAVFQWGWGGALLGVGEKVPIESYVPMMMFAIVFGLSMDYEVFLLSRVRESWLRTKDNHTSVATGLSQTGRVISCAALIMTSVFLAFLLSTSVTVKMLALGLGVSVLVDATIIRLLVVPATMYVLDKANWWIPAWLDRMLPHLDLEGAPTSAVAPSDVDATTTL